MQLDKLTLKSQEALQDAQRLAREHSHQEMDGEHLRSRCPDQAGRATGFSLRICILMR